MLVVSLAAQLALAVLLSLCGLWNARLTPVLLGGPLLTVVWATGMLFKYAS